MCSTKSIDSIAIINSASFKNYYNSQFNSTKQDTFNCYGANSCKNMTFTWSHDISLNCYGVYSCQNIKHYNAELYQQDNILTCDGFHSFDNTLYDIEFVMKNKV